MSTGAAKHPSIGIIGGMGPWVDPLILKKCLEQQVRPGMSRDQDTIPILLAQYAALIHDRTEYLESLEHGEICPNPGVEVANIARVLVADGARVLGVPCNTFHAAPIFSRFKADLGEFATDESVEVVHMIHATVDDILAANTRFGVSE